MGTFFAYPHPAADRDQVDPVYWLQHCDGYRVAGPDGWIGTVRQVRLGSDRVDSRLIIRSGLFREHYLRVSAAQIDHIDPCSQVVTLLHDPRRGNTEP